jgi:cyclophilin family peptidyl-prolyl cis-trans isomerase
MIMSRQRAIAILASALSILVAAGVLASCSSSPSSTTGNTSQTTAAANDTQAYLDRVAVKAGCPSSTSTNLETLPSHASLHWPSPPPTTIDTSTTYRATVKTDIGTFVISLNPTDSIPAVNNFVFLAEQGFFNCVIFHRVIPGFVVQGGDPTGTGTGGPGYQFTASGPPKASNPSQQYPLGSVAMANSSPGTTTPTTNGSQFFIVTGPQGEALPPDYVLFGQVTSGMSVVNTINDDGSTSGVPPKITHRMLKVTINS